MEQREINGFKIDVYNRFGLDTTKKLTTCPICSKNRKPEHQKEKCFKIDWEKGLGTCFNQCGLVQLHTYKRKDESKTYNTPKSKHIINYSEEFIAYHFKRGISLETIRRAKVTEGFSWMPKSKKEIKTTQYNYLRLGKLINIKHRGIDGIKEFKMENGCELIPYNIDAIEFTDDVIICEGEEDVLSYMECGFDNCTSVPNGANSLEWLDNSWQWFENKKRFYLAIDDDEAGIKLRNELIRRLGSEKCYIINYSTFKKSDLSDCKDGNDVLCHHGTEALKSTIINAKLCPIENIETFNTCNEKLINFFLNGMPRGYTTGHLKLFDEKFSTYSKQYIVVTGIPTHGKSEFVDEMSIGWSINNDLKGVYASPENQPIEIHQSKILRKVIGYTPKNRFDVEGEKYTNGKDFCNEHLYFIELDYYDLDVVLDKIREMIFRKGVKFFILDPYNKVRLKTSKQNINEITNEYLQKIDSFCKKYDVFGVLVAHPRKPESGEKQYKPTFYDIKGGGEFFDMSYHGISIWRNFDQNYVEITIMKVKFSHLGENNAKLYFAYNVNNGRFTQINNIDDYINGIEKPNWDNSNWLYLPKNDKKEITENYFEPNFNLDNEFTETPF